MTHNYYYLDEAGEIAGPLDVTLMRAMLSSKALTGKSQVCRQGTDKWQKLSAYPELALSHDDMLAIRLANEAKAHAVPGIVGWFRLCGWVIVVLGVICMALGLLATPLGVLSVPVVAASVIPLAALMFGAGWVLTWLSQIQADVAAMRHRIEQD